MFCSTIVATSPLSGHQTHILNNSEVVFSQMQLFNKGRAFSNAIPSFGSKNERFEETNEQPSPALQADPNSEKANR
jgi:hypothetical protein